MRSLPGLHNLTKPALGRQVDWGHRLARQLQRCHLFNEAVGTVVNDSCFGLQATCANTSWVTANASRVGPAVSCISTNSATITGSSQGWAFGASPFTWSMYVMSGGGTNVNFASYGASSGSNNVTFMTASGTKFQIHAGSVYINGSSYSTSIWYRVTATYDGATLSLYQNDALIASSAAALATTSNGFWQIGSNTSVSSFGTVQTADMFYWNRCLSAGEVAWLFQEPYAMVSPPNYKKYYMFGYLMNPLFTRIINAADRSRIVRGVIQ